MLPDVREDALTVIRARAGHAPALRALYRSSEEITKHLANRFASDPKAKADFHEIASSSVASAVATFCLCKHYARHGRFTTYAFRIARNRILDELRRHRRQPQTVSYSQMSKENPSWLALDLDVDLSRSDVQAWAAGLRPMRRGIIVALLEGESTEDIETRFADALSQRGTTLEVEMKSLQSEFADRFMGRDGQH